MAYITEASEKIWTMSEMELKHLVNNIFYVLDGNEWDSDTCSIIAERFELCGIEIAEAP